MCGRYRTSACWTIPCLPLPVCRIGRKDPSGTVIESCTFLTSTPNSLLADVHDLSPACTKSARCRRGRSPSSKRSRAI